MEIAHLCKFMQDEELDLAWVIKNTTVNNVGLAHQFKQQLQQLKLVNALHCEHFDFLLNDSR